MEGTFVASEGTIIVADGHWGKGTANAASTFLLDYVNKTKATHEELISSFFPVAFQEAQTHLRRVHPNDTSGEALTIAMLDS